MNSTAPASSGSRNSDSFASWFRKHHTPVIVGTLCLILAIGVRIDRVLLNTFPTGGDNGGHLGMPAYVKRVLAPQWRLTGWSNDWFAGVPILGLYFPLPTWLIIGLSTVLPYSVAYKLVTILGTVGLPWAAWRLGHKAQVTDPGPLYLACATLPFLLNRTYHILGGNILSTMAGEFSFSLSLLFCLLYFGTLLDVLRFGTHRARATMLLAATGLSHVVPSMLAAIGTVALLLCFRRPGKLRQQTKDTAIVGFAALLLTGFWVLPFASLLPYSNSMDYERNTVYTKSLFPFLTDKITLHVFSNGAAIVAGAFALCSVALVWGLLKKQRLVYALALMGLGAAVGFVVWPTGSMWNNRLLPLWFLCVYLLAGLGLAAIARPLTRRPFASPLVAIGVLFVACAGSFDALPGSFPLPVKGPKGWRFESLSKNKDYSDADLPFSWAATNAEGMQRKKAWPEYAALLKALKPLPCGRLFWE